LSGRRARNNSRAFLCPNPKALKNKSTNSLLALKI
jgi:hypothetical protein